MIKPNLRLGALALIIAITVGAVPVHAVEVDSIDCVADPANEACAVVTSDDNIVEPIDEPTDINPITEDKTEEIEEETEEESEPETWPMYLSFGALGAAVVVFIILNLFSRSKKK